MDIDYAELERKAKAATQGPWHSLPGTKKHQAMLLATEQGVPRTIAGFGMGGDSVKEYSANAAYAAAVSPDVVLELLRRLEEEEEWGSLIIANFPEANVTLGVLRQREARRLAASASEDK